MATRGEEDKLLTSFFFFRRVPASPRLRVSSFFLTFPPVAFTWKSALVGLLIFVVTFTASIAIVSFLLVKLPATYFHSSHDRELWQDKHKVVRWTGIILKNLLGLILVVAGVIMAIPGVPGQGLLTILFGIMLLDFPGKRQLELKLVGRAVVLSRINQLRGKFDKPPLVLD